MNIAFLSLGGNLGNRRQNIAKAIQQIEALCGKVLKTSAIYETEAWGSPSKKKYLNCVVKLQTALDAEGLMKTLLHIEARLGRKRTHQYSDRTMDLDILFFNREIIQRKDLHIPHARLHLRNFVLVPLHEIEKKLVHPVLKKTIGALLKESNDTLAVTFYTSQTPRYICIEGNIASGKSTLALALAKKLNARYLPEKFEENSLLPLFYAKPQLYAFPLEYSFLIGRFQQLADCFRTTSGPVVSDFSFYKCLWFAKTNLPAKEYKLFKKHFLALLDQLPQPDLLVYQYTDVSNLERNIKKRGRPYEQHIPSRYLREVEKHYKNGMAKLKLKKLAIPVKTYHSGLERATIKTIENYLKENFGQAGQKSYI